MNVLIKLVDDEVCSLLVYSLVFKVAFQILDFDILFIVWYVFEGLN